MEKLYINPAFKSTVVGFLEIFVFFPLFISHNVIYHAFILSIYIYILYNDSSTINNPNKVALGIALLKSVLLLRCGIVYSPYSTFVGMVSLLLLLILFYVSFRIKIAEYFKKTIIESMPGSVDTLMKDIFDTLKSPTKKIKKKKQLVTAIMELTEQDIDPSQSIETNKPLSLSSEDNND